MGNPAAFFWIFLLLGCLRIPFMLFRRQQIRNNPARQAAGAEDVTFRTTILLRFKNPGRLLLSQHWFYGKASPIELIVRTSTFQVTRWGLGRRSRHYGGWFLPSSGSTMWVARMRFFPLGQQECIVVAGTYPWRGGQRQVELAMGTQGRSAEIWAALAASGVRPLSGPGAPAAPPAQRELHGISYGIPRPAQGAPPPGVPYATVPLGGRRRAERARPLRSGTVRAELREPGQRGGHPRPDRSSHRPDHRSGALLPVPGGVHLRPCRQSRSPQFLSFRRPQRIASRGDRLRCLVHARRR